MATSEREQMMIRKFRNGLLNKQVAFIMATRALEDTKYQDFVDQAVNAELVLANSTPYSSADRANPIQTVAEIMAGTIDVVAVEPTPKSMK